ncbi:unnamed protein product [Hyaloperonospora brassicae]|uniref:Uncharacterized protein n=1 Tax=Hyaloperonospora brassicae TaxID=162125 RepID=A0AAV0UNE8_HYABA|nr:unnamed protein product [Hyaloperonospora brassicae]
MSLGAFVAGVAVGGLRYGAVKLQLQEREDVVLYSARQVKESFSGHGHTQLNYCRYEALPSREHVYYTYVREGWNAKVLALRTKMDEGFSTK